MIEPWLRGSLPDLDPVVSHLLRASQQIREELQRALAPLSLRQIDAGPQGMTSVGFHARHLAGSTERLCAYLEGRGLTDEELAAIESEHNAGQNAAELIGRVNRAFEIYETHVRALTPDGYRAIRYIGRHRLPVTAVSLAIHIVEHGQRHVGQAISAAKLARAAGSD